MCPKGAKAMPDQDMREFLSDGAEPGHLAIAMKVYQERLDMGDSEDQAAIAACRAVLNEIEGNVTVERIC